MIALDSSAIIDLFKGDVVLKDLITSLDDKTFVTSIICYQEVFFGLNPKSSKYSFEREYYENFFSALDVFDLDKASCEKASEIFWHLSSKGKTSSAFDCMIAGNLLTKGVNVLITKNVKHFESITGLKVIGY